MERLYLVLCLFVYLIPAQAGDLDGVVACDGIPHDQVTVTATPVAAGATVQGVIRDRITGNGISGAQIFLDVKPLVGGASPVVAVSGVDGSYTLSGLPAELVSLQAWAMGYGNRFAVNLDLTAGGIYNYDFQMDAVPVDEEYFVVLYVSFDNLDFNPNHDETWFDRLLFDSTPGAASVRNYFYEISRGRLDLKKGVSAQLHCSEPDLQYPHDSWMRDDLADWALPVADSWINFTDPRLDRFDNYDHDPDPDGDLDHVLIIPAGLPQSLTGAKNCDMNPVSMWNTISGLDGMTTSYQNVVPEYSPLGNFVHEIMHTMGENYAQDLYIGGTCEDETTDDLSTVGKWGLMSVGMYNGFDSAFVDPRGGVCEPYVDPCDNDPDCWINRAGAQPAYAMPWIQRERWYRRHYQDTVTTQTLGSGQSSTIRLYPYAGSGPETRIISVLDPGNSSANWHITLRLPLGTDRGLAAYEHDGATGVVIDYTDRTLTGSQNLRGPVRVRDVRPNTPPPAHLHFKCRFQVDDAALNIGEIDTYNEGPLSVQLVTQYPDGSVDVTVSVGNSLAPKKDIALESGAHTYEEFLPHADHVHEDLPGPGTDTAGHPIIKPSGSKPLQGKTAYQTTTDSQGRYTLNLENGNWQITWSKCGLTTQSTTLEIDGNTTYDVNLEPDASTTPVAAISSPASGSYDQETPISLDASGSSGATAWQWTSDVDGLLAGSETATISLSAGFHQITLTVSNGGCSDTTSVMVTITDLTAPVISLVETPAAGPGPWTVSAEVLENGGLASGYPILAYNAGSGWQDVTMSSDGNAYSGEIPDQSEGTVVEWYVRAADNAGNLTTAPAGITPQSPVGAYSFTVSAGSPQTVLIMDRDGGDSVSGLGMAEALAAELGAIAVQNVTLSGESALLTDYDLGSYDVVFISLGGFPGAGRLSSAESDQLRDYLDAGGALYIEGGDVGYHHRYKSFWNRLGAIYEDDGGTDNDMGSVMTGTGGHPIGNGLSFGYTDQDGSVESWVDELSPVSGAETFLRSSKPSDETDSRAISYIGSSGSRSVTVSASFGGMVSGSSRTDYMSALFTWLTGR